jgi:UrcA family protein
MFTKTTLTTLATLAALGFAAGGHAAPATGLLSDSAATSAKVSVADLDLGGDAGAKAVLQRIHDAARNVCADELNPLACRDDTIGRAVASLGNPVVTALNGGQGRAATILASRAH